MNKKIVVFDRYDHKPNKPRRQIQQIQAALLSEGYSSTVVSHREAKKLLDSGNDPTKGYGGYLDTGSNVSGKKRGNYVKVADKLDLYLAKNKKPGVHVCRSHQGLAEIISNEETTDTGEWNRKTDEKGRVFHHKYGVIAKSLMGKVKNLKTFKHAGHELAMEYTIDNKLARQDHPERTTEGIKALGQHFDKHLGFKKGDAKNKDIPSYAMIDTSYKKAA